MQTDVRLMCFKNGRGARMAEEFNLDGMVDIYIYENGQLLENLEEIVLETKDDDAFDENSINEIFRIMHTIKGSSGVMMYDNIMKVSHKLEDIFYYLRENIGIEEPHMELTDIVFQVLDFINGEMEKIKDGNDPDGDNSQLIDLMDKFLVKLKGVIDSANGVGEEPSKEEASPASAGMNLEQNQFYIAPQVSGAAKCFRIKSTYHEDTQMSNLRAYSATYALKEFTEDVHYSPEDILTDESSSDTILAEGFQMLVRGDFTNDKLHELLDTTS